MYEQLLKYIYMRSSLKAVVANLLVFKINPFKMGSQWLYVHQNDVIIIK